MNDPGPPDFYLVDELIDPADLEIRDRLGLPPMARLEKIGAFALTEPEHGSDAVLLETSARRDGEEHVLRGRKRWIGNGSIADVVVVWARDEDGGVGGFVVEKDSPGYHAAIMGGKTSLRAVWQTGPGQAQPDAGRGHRDAAAVPAAQPAHRL